MEISRHICFTRKDAPELADYLAYYGIPFTETLGNITVDIPDSDPHFPFVWDIVQRKQLFYLSETHFTKEEQRQAPWLHVRSQWRFGYPQPEAAFKYESITYSSEEKCPECSCGLKQINPFRIKKTPKWGKRYFGELNWIGDELFVSNAAKTVLECSGLTGVGFLPVQNSKGTETLPDIYQLHIPHILEQGMPEEQDYIRQFSNCSACGRKKYVTSGIGMMQFRDKLFQGAPDFVKTGEYFGSGFYATRSIILSQRAYRIIMENKLDQGLVFEPVTVK